MTKEESDKLLEASLNVFQGIISDIDAQTKETLSRILVNSLVRGIDAFSKNVSQPVYNDADTLGSYVIYFLQQFMNTPAVQKLHVRFFSSVIVSVIGGYSQVFAPRAPATQQEVNPNGGAQVPPR